ncbi:MAG: hypothetical protein A2445_02180 [Candidatus Jacksonbacteria bacterium RIFOXYC2_FULL_44_29]|nr:MAG: Transcriptional regulator TrmB [Parcubacteria group bacterium GW2011_GWC2_44_22]OGY76645.1 MAG: hypothetical protein A2240_02415 [Candidatus Jacksonbacteria bacterium RIFOXYA2_FULL_43_12]OGY77857.1 MAG: hypothetical protein A2295_05570 [Candidatus Jacksonbacteria bacterium RIFOXYB2_FULL_44_15]OGY78390.1 MAG: hypothetical protein A2550_06540 [Candidatus Jacksonbacteria bacterium RIFOXYD2_FULL_43_21]OGY81096.1 MAG: hypothetical protein A2445_02180 [Candidatus Jacksonbacteria bacterium RIF
MFQETLQQLGLSLNEAKIYEALLDLNEAGVGQISSATKVHRRNVYDAIKRLVDKGLVFPILSHGENTYCPVDPEKLLELVKEKEEQLTKILPELQSKYQARHGDQEAYIYRGIEGFKNHLRDILRAGSDVYFVGGKLIWFDPKIKGFISQFFKEAKRKKIKFHSVFDAEVKARGGEDLKNYDPPHRFLPKEFATESALIIFGDCVVTYADVKFKQLAENITMFVLRDAHLAESYRTWFKFIAAHCTS